MQHTPFGYRIEAGKAIVDEEKANLIVKVCENYLKGMSFVTAAADVGLEMSHCGVKRMIQNKRYLGDDFYPAILTKEMSEQIEEERLRRLKKLGRDKRINKQEEVVVCTSFHLPRITTKYDDPVKQAEYAYSLIEREEG